VRLETQAERLPGQLSGGQQQRVAIARAIAIDPPLVLMDEPLSNLDAKLRLEMRQEIRRIHQGLGCVTIYVTHDQDEALSLADRIVVLRDGEVRQIGPPQELYARPARLDVAEFMGFRNCLSGRAASAAGLGAVKFAFGETMLEGVDMGLGGVTTAVAAIRPDDLTLAPEGATGIPARVEAIEYRGRDFFGSARTDGSIELYFRSAAPLQPGARVKLAAEPSKVLVYPGDAP
jgi:putative spermidine/putrescine transport system ATP-binding protein